ncbi:hypothetical protein FACS1894103_1780 [Campylobacterota bacterium]|nr:hypothetical protein FACS1894103_1780 [Campylobacterota bacterium]
MTIEIRALELQAVIGILPHERETAQRLVIDATIDYEYHKGEFVDYAVVCELIEHELVISQFELIETALEAIVPKIFALSETISAVRLGIAKPDALESARAKVILSVSRSAIR